MQGWSAALSCIASIVGVIYIVRTLCAQLKVNQDQNELLQIEKRRAAREIKPKLSITYKSSQEKAHTYSLLNENHPASGVCFEYLQLPPIGVYSDNLKPGSPLGNMPIDGEIEFAMNAVAPSYERPAIIRVHYKDEDERPIQQDFWLSKELVKPYSDNKVSKYPSINKRHATCGSHMLPLSAPGAENQWLHELDGS